MYSQKAYIMCKNSHRPQICIPYTPVTYKQKKYTKNEYTTHTPPHKNQPKTVRQYNTPKMRGIVKTPLYCDTRYLKGTLTKLIGH
jgi:hypothetical protein